MPASLPAESMPCGGIADTDRTGRGGLSSDRHMSTTSAPSGTANSPRMTGSVPDLDVFPRRPLLESLRDGPTKPAFLISTASFRLAVGRQATPCVHARRGRLDGNDLDRNVGVGQRLVTD